MPFNPQDLLPVVYLCFALLAPLVPAIAIYKGLPMSDTHVSGPFHGLQIKLGGAFAGYFLLVLVSGYFIKMSKPQNYEVWEIEGKFKLDSNAEIESGKHPISIIPPLARVHPDGRFKVLVAVPHNHNGGLDFPGLALDYGDEYETVSVPLYELAQSSEASVTVGAANNTIVLKSDSAARRIKLNGEVELKHKPANKEKYSEINKDAVEPVKISINGAEGQP